MHLDHVTLLDRSVAAIEDEIEAAVTAIPAAWGISEAGVPTPDPDPGPDAKALTAADRLAEAPGISPKLAIAIIAETGLAMTRFPTADHLVSWAGLAPVARQSGPRSRTCCRAGGSRRRGVARAVRAGRGRAEALLPDAEWPELADLAGPEEGLVAEMVVLAGERLEGTQFVDVARLA
jgi:transposase